MELQASDFAWVVDGIVGVLIVVSAYLAMVRGLFREIFALASWAIAFAAAFVLAPLLQPSLDQLPAVGPYLADCAFAMIAAGAIIFVLALIATSIVIWAFGGTIRNPTFSIVDQVAGFIFGAIRGLVLVAVIYLLYEMVVPSAERAGQFAFVEEALTIDLVKQSAAFIDELTPDEIPGWFEGQVDRLLRECEAGV